jgi:hypothetical protein
MRREERRSMRREEKREGIESRSERERGVGLE